MLPGRYAGSSNRETRDPLAPSVGATMHAFHETKKLRLMRQGRSHMPHELKSPGEIREHILRDHVRLRALLQDIRMLTHSAEKDSAVSDTLRHSLMEFIEVFFRHLESEESLLPDVVEGADSWGPERLAHMSEEHSAQRAALRELSYRAQKEPPQALAADANALVDTILRDMSAEERDLLGEDVLRDDIVAIDQSGG